MACYYFFIKINQAKFLYNKLICLSQNWHQFIVPFIQRVTKNLIHKILFEIQSLNWIHSWFISNLCMLVILKYYIWLNFSILLTKNFKLAKFLDRIKILIHNNDQESNKIKFSKIQSLDRVYSWFAFQLFCMLLHYKKKHLFGRNFSMLFLIK